MRAPLRHACFAVLLQSLGTTSTMYVAPEALRTRPAGLLNIPVTASMMAQADTVIIRNTLGPLALCGVGLLNTANGEHCQRPACLGLSRWGMEQGAHARAHAQGLHVTCMLRGPTEQRLGCVGTIPCVPPRGAVRD